MNLGNLFSGPDMASRLMPEWILVLGIIAMILVPNLGKKIEYLCACFLVLLALLFHDMILN